MPSRFRWVPLLAAALIFHAAAFAQTGLQVRLTASNGAINDRFGRTLDMDGNVAVVAAKNGVFPYVWERIGDTWHEVAQLDPGEPISAVIYGYSVAVSGQRIAVGAPEDPQAGPRRSAVHIFEKVGGIWTHTDRITINDFQTNDYFGGSVDLSGDRLVVGAEGANIEPAQLQGAAYVFLKGSMGWTLEDKLVSADGTTYDLCGGTVAIEGDRVVFGCIGADNGQGTPFFDAGAVYVFQRSGSDWSQAAKLTAPSQTQNDFLGRRLALSGDTIAAGATGARVNNLTRQGAVDVFERVGNTWQHRSRVVASDGQAEQQFGGYGLALTGNRLYAGLTGHSVNGEIQGSVYTYQRDTSGDWVQINRIEAFDGPLAGNFAESIAASGSDVMVGAGTYDTSKGAVYLLFDGLLFKDGFEASMQLPARL